MDTENWAEISEVASFCWEKIQLAENNISQTMRSLKQIQEKQTMQRQAERLHIRYLYNNYKL